VASAALVERIRAIHRASRGTYGSPRVWRELQAAGHACSRHRTARLMRGYGIRGQAPRRFVVTTHAHGKYAVADNLLARRFAPGAVGALVADITWLPTGEGPLYLAVVLSLRSRRVLGWATSDRQHSSGALAALRSAVERCPQPPGTLHHSDRGVQYASHAYQALLAQHGLVASMSRPANCYDNAVAESFFATLKKELGGRHCPPTRQAAQTLVGDWIENFYNSRRRHSAIGYRSPLDYEKLPL
jgi:transposase InsO family protein